MSSEAASLLHSDLHDRRFPRQFMLKACCSTGGILWKMRLFFRFFALQHVFVLLEKGNKCPKL